MDNITPLCTDCQVYVLSFLRYDMISFIEQFGYFSDDPYRTIYHIFKTYKKIPIVQSTESNGEFGISTYTRAIQDQNKIYKLYQSSGTSDELTVLPFEKQIGYNNPTWFAIEPIDHKFIVGILLIVPNSVLPSIESVKILNGGHELIFIPHHLLRWMELKNQHQLQAISAYLEANNKSVPQDSIIINIGSPLCSSSSPRLSGQKYHSYNVRIHVKNDNNHEQIMEQLNAYTTICKRDIEPNRLERIRVACIDTTILQFDYSHTPIQVLNNMLKTGVTAHDVLSCAIFIRWRKTEQCKSMPKYIVCLFPSQTNRPTKSVAAQQSEKFAILDAEQCLLNNEVRPDALFPEFEGVAPWMKGGDEPDTYWYCIRFSDLRNAPSQMLVHQQCPRDELYAQPSWTFSRNEYAVIADGPCQPEQAVFFVALRNILRSTHGLEGAVWA